MNKSSNHICDKDEKLSIDKLLTGAESKTWQGSLDNELGWLVEGFKTVQRTKTILFINKEEIPWKKKITKIKRRFGLQCTMVRRGQESVRVPKKIP